MGETRSVVETAYFESLYSMSNDPWGMESRWYERRRVSLILASLPREHFDRGFEPGCGAGMLTTQLAGRCNALDASDCAPSAVAHARSRVMSAGLENVVRLSVSEVPREWPRAHFDLIVVSELACYLSSGDQRKLAECATRSLNERGVLVSSHVNTSAEQRSSRVFAAALVGAHGLRRMVCHRDICFELDVFVFCRDNRPPAADPSGR